VSEGEDPCQGVPQPDQRQADDSADRPVPFHEMDLDVGGNLHSLRFDAATKAIVDWGRRIDAANAARDRSADLLGELAWRADVRGQLDVRVAAALKVVAAAVDVSPHRLRVAVADALEADKS
jgi:hypothetical protein